jgi:hypothetical protein
MVSDPSVRRSTWLFSTGAIGICLTLLAVAVLGR